jgi:ketosteroid isomerase-like protein
VAEHNDNNNNNARIVSKGCHMRTISILAAAALSGCAVHAETDNVQHNIAVTQSEEWTLAKAQHAIDTNYIAPFKAGKVEQWLEIFDKDAIGLHNRMPAMEGKEGLRGFGRFVAQNLDVTAMSVKLTGIRQEGDLAYSWGTYRSSLIMRSSGLPMPGHSGEGKVFFVWKKQADNSWKIAADMGNDLPAPNGN